MNNLPLSRTMIDDHPHTVTLPTELSYKILEQVWSGLPLSTAERRDLLVALPSVSSHSISAINPPPLPHPCRHHFLLVLSNSMDLESHDSRIGDHTSLHNARCARPRPSSCRTALHRVVLHSRTRTRTPINLPPHVQSLELLFSTPTIFAQHLRQSYLRCYTLPMPGVRTLRIFGTCPEFVVDVARACPALESLETDDTRGVLALQPSLRPFMLQTANDDATQEVKQSKHLEWRNAPEEASVAHALAKAFGDLRRKPSRPHNLSKKKPARI
ncbi:hypothetical protein B0F90DRAFT_1820547 [Multifurca ochricompacta]|uniref:Uncharacterized protein n=1 Tax=Multifurca ochricompacta TaxID=376703 RepID=A0AAD4LYI4_9AGAM|nr:hypothetical protein B0F90DRAFT_1820547 [Multifurca ochricompacta]